MVNRYHGIRGSEQARQFGDAVGQLLRAFSMSLTFSGSLTGKLIATNLLNHS